MRLQSKIGEIAKNQGYTPIKLSKHLVISQQAVYALWDNPDIGLSRISTISSISRVLGVKVEDLYEVVDNGSDG